MRSAEDFNSFYQSPDPWKIGRATRRDRVLARIVGPHVAGKTVLELGCGEGHLTATIFKDASSVKGIVPSESDWKANSGTSLKNEDHEASITKTAGPMNAGDAHVHEIDTSPNVVLDFGVLKTPEGGSGNRSIASGAGEHATPAHGAGVHAFEPSSMPQVVSGGTVGTPGDSFHFKDEISGSKGSGVINVAELNDIPASMSHHEDAARTQGPLAISDGAQAIELPPPGQHPDNHFNIVPDHAPSALVTHVPHDLIV